MGKGPNPQPTPTLHPVSTRAKATPLTLTVRAGRPGRRRRPFRDGRRRRAAAWEEEEEEEEDENSTEEEAEEVNEGAEP